MILFQETQDLATKPMVVERPIKENSKPLEPIEMKPMTEDLKATESMEVEKPKQEKHKFAVRNLIDGDISHNLKHAFSSSRQTMWVMILHKNYLVLISNPGTYLVICVNQGHSLFLMVSIIESFRVQHAKEEVILHAQIVESRGRDWTVLNAKERA